MAIHHRKQTNILLTFKVVQFVTQLRRRVRLHALDGPTSSCQLGSDALGLRALKGDANGRLRIGRRTKRPHHLARRARKTRRSDIHSLRSSLKLQTSARDVSAASYASGEQVQHTLNSVDKLSPRGFELSVIAGNDERFLKHGNAAIYESFTLNQTIRLIVVVNEAIRTLASCRLQYGDDWLLDQGLLSGLNMDQCFIANYEYLLLRLEAELEGVLARKALEELLQGGHDKRQRKLLAWFSEFAEKPQPMSTSFPWTIKPSLAVLWGVCWMFYDNDKSSVPRERLLQQLNFPGNYSWDAPASVDYLSFGLELIGAAMQQNGQPSPQDNVTAELDEVFQARNAETWHPDLHPLNVRLPEHEEADMLARFDQAPPHPPCLTTYYPHGHDNFAIDSSNTSFLPRNQGSPLDVYSHLGSNSLNSPWLRFPSSPQQSPRHPTNAVPPSIRVIGTTGDESAPPQFDFAAFSRNIYQQPQAQPLQIDTTLQYTTPYETMGSQLSPDNATIQVPQNPIKHERTSSIASVTNMLTPTSMSGPRSPLPSPTSGEQSHIVANMQSHNRRISEDRSSQGDDEDGSLRKNYSHKRAEEPRRNQDGKMICAYHECADLVFDRKCEWSKHMDKHDRPYKCNVRGCEKLQGFTYSGGLLRHEREVHKMHGGTKKSLFCPFADCKRSSGAGFTRKENLAEHIRRVHRRTSMSADLHGLIVRRETLEGSPILESRASESPTTRVIEYREDSEVSMHKRKRGSDSGLSDRGTDDLRAEIKRLRQENDEKDSRLHMLEQAVMALQQTKR